MKTKTSTLRLSKSAIAILNKDAISIKGGITRPVIILRSGTCEWY